MTPTSMLMYNETVKRINYTSVGEEIFNAISHGVGAVASIAGFTFLMVMVSRNPSPARFWGMLIFGITLVLLYLTSTLFHSLMFTRAKKVFKALDYSAIALFIAGTYTPIALVTLKNDFGWALLVGVWILAVAGIVWRVLGNQKDSVSLLLYLFTGWLIVLYIKPLVRLLPLPAMLLLVTGGLSYTIGTIFFQWRRPVFSHGIWHLFVLGGSVCHFFVMMYIR